LAKRIVAEPATEASGEQTILDQLRVALVVAPSAPPANGFQIQAVNIRSFISRRSLA
jgi:hypothetical protein